MKVEVDSSDYVRMSPKQLTEYLRNKGLDLTKAVREYECPTRHYSRIFIGESLEDKVVGYIKTVVGLVPITEPWES